MYFGPLVTTIQPIIENFQYFQFGWCNSLMCFQKVLNNIYKLWKTWIMEDLWIFVLKFPKVGNLTPEHKLLKTFRFFYLYRCNSPRYSQKVPNHFSNIIFSQYTSISSWPPILAHCEIDIKLPQFGWNDHISISKHIFSTLAQ